MKRFIIVSIAALIALCSCGGTDNNYDPSITTQAYPVINRVEPNSGTSGDIITIYGIGFSSAAAQNIILLGNSSTVADSYALVNPPVDGEVEQITFVIPDGVTPGIAELAVNVLENTSNTLEFTLQ